MFRFDALCVLVLLLLTAGAATAQSPANSPPPPNGMTTPRPAHSPPPASTDNEKANPSDPASPPLADPLKQQAVMDPPPTLATPAVEFIMKASMDGFAEIQLGQAALTHSKAANIQEFARRMITDHQTLNASLGALASSRGTSVPTVLDADHAGVVERLNGLRGPAFDKAYAHEALVAHDRALALYSAATSLSDADVATFAARSMPVLRGHASLARSL